VPQRCEKELKSTNHIFKNKPVSKSPKTQINQPLNARNIFHAVPRWQLCWLIWHRRDGIPAKMQSFSFEPQRVVQEKS
jgi:hypothetical protein